VGKSVTEWEVRSALGPYPVELNKETGLCWSHRTLAGEINDSSCFDFLGGCWRKKDKDYCDTDVVGGNTYIKDSFDELIRVMQDQIPESVRRTYGDELMLSDLKAKNAKQVEYVYLMETFLQSAMEVSLQSVFDKQETYATDGNGLGIQGENLTEMLHHCTVGNI
jgi:hypothetical protein